MEDGGGDGQKRYTHVCTHRIERGRKGEKPE